MPEHTNKNPQVKSDNHNGIVITNFGNEALIEDQTGQRLRAIPRQSLPGLVTGDHITWAQNQNGLASITELHQRHGILSRQASNKQEKVFAANIDSALIICACKPAYKTGLIDRYLAACEMANITPYIIFNKADLIPEKKHHKINEDLDTYRGLGYTVLTTSVKNKQGLDQLTALLQGKTAILVGQSGVGKSSLISALIPGANPRIANISDASHKGRHTTTHSELYHLGNSGRVIDSPGIREFGLREVSPQILATGFIDFRPYAQQCRFRNCTHTGDPGCAIEQAVIDGNIRQIRLDSYRAILASFQTG